MSPVHVCPFYITPSVQSVTVAQQSEASLANLYLHSFNIRLRVSSLNSAGSKAIDHTEECDWHGSNCIRS